MSPKVSIIIPMKNASAWIQDCLDSVLAQDYRPLEVSLYDDVSTDESPEMVLGMRPAFAEHSIDLLYNRNPNQPGPYRSGPGFAKNRAVDFCTGEVLCFLDADDVMLPGRVRKQVELLTSLPPKTQELALVGCNIRRLPEGATNRYTVWANTLTPEQLLLQQYRECTVLMPTWLLLKKRFLEVGGFSEEGVGTPEDLMFFHEHLGRGGGLHKVPEPLLVYRYHVASVSKGIHRNRLVSVRVAALQSRVLARWDAFTIWGAGRDGKRFFNSLSPLNQDKVVAFCDIDPTKVGTEYQTQTGRSIPILHFREAKRPLVVCVALTRVEAELRRNIDSLGLKEGDDYWFFN